MAAAKEKEMVRKAKASAGLPPFGEKKQETLIELQNSRYSNDAKQQQQELQEQINLRMLEEQEASIRQLEVFCLLATKIKIYKCLNRSYFSIFESLRNVHTSFFSCDRTTLATSIRYSKISEPWCTIKGRSLIP